MIRGKGGYPFSMAVLNKKRSSLKAQQGSENLVSMQCVRLLSSVDKHAAHQELVLTGFLWWLGVQVAKRVGSSFCRASE